MKYSTKTKRFVHWAVGGLASCFMAVAVIGQTSFTESSSITINDNGPATPYPSTNLVQNTVGVIEKVTVTLNGVSHTNPDDIDMILEGPDGTKTMLMSDAGGQFDLANTTFTLDSTASTALPNEGQIVDGTTYQPANYDGGDADNFPAPSPAPTTSLFTGGSFQGLAANLAIFNGKSGAAVNNTWNLYVVDDTVIDSGSIRSWSLNLFMSPTLSITNSVPVAMTEDTPATINIFANDTDTPLSNLSLSATSSDQSIIKDSGLSFGGDRTGTNRTLTITPVANASGGPVTITVTVKDEQGQVIAGVNQKTFTVNVAAVNDAPTFVSVGTSATSIPQGGISTNIFLKVGDVDNLSSDLVLTATSSNPSVIPATNVLFSRVVDASIGTNRVVQIAAGDTVGTAVITLNVTDPSGASTSTTITATVTGVPSVVKANPTTISVPDTGDGSATPYPSIITVPNSTGLGLIGKVVVSLINVEAAIPSDLGVLLVSPSGRSVVLMRAAGDSLPIGLGDTNDVRLTFDPDAANSITSAQLTTSSYRPSDSGAGNFPGTAPAGPYSVDLASLSGTAANGDWKLYVYDTATGNSASAKIAGGWLLQILSAPTIATIPAQTTLEDTPLTVAFQIGDFDGSVTNITAQFDASKVSVAASVSGSGLNGTGTLVITPAPNFNTGTPAVPIPITVTAKDTSGFTTTTTFNLTVTPVNDAPTQTVIPKQIARAGQSVGPVPFTVGDVETAPANLVVTATSDNPKLLPPGAIILGVSPSDASGATRTVTIFPAGAQGGTATITVTVTDDGAGSPTGTPASSSQTFNLTVNEAANPLFENTTGIAINDATGTVASPIPGQATPYPSIINVSGLVGSIAEVQVTLYGITDQNPDDLDILLVGPGTTPVSLILMSDIGDDKGLTNVTLRFRQSATVPITDFDNSQLVSGDYQPGNIGGGDVFPNGASSLTPSAISLDAFIGTNPNGDWKLYVVDDSPTTGVTVKQIISSWQLSVRTRPVLAAIPDQTTAENTPLRLTISLGDNQPGVPFTVTAAVAGSPNAVASIATSSGQVIGPSGATVFGGSQTFTITPIPNTSGLNKITNQVTLTFTDPNNVPVTQTFNLIILPVDEAPVFGNIADQATQAATPVSFTFTVSDPEGTAVSVVASSSSQDIVADSAIAISPNPSTTASRTITITPNGIANGPITITLVATDATGQKSTKTFALAVNPNVSFSNKGAPITINDNAPATPYPSTIDVAGVNGTVSGASVVLLGFSHVFPDDVDILLVAPDGTHSVMLMSDAGGGNSVSNYRLTFAMGNPAVPDSSSLVNGATYSPANYDGGDLGEMPSPAPAPNFAAFPNGGYSVDLNSLAGVDPNGQWKLYVRDDTFPDGGSISGGWILLLQTAPTISAIPTQTTPEHTVLPVRFTVSDQDTITSSNPANLNLPVTFTVDSSAAPGLLNAAQITLVTNSITPPIASYTLNIPATNRLTVTIPETNSVSVIVFDGTTHVTNTFQVVVLPVNDAPVILGAFEPAAPFTFATNHVVTGQTTTSPAATRPVTITFKVQDEDSVLGTSSNIVVQSSNTALLPNNVANIAVSGPDNVAPNTQFTVSVTLTPAANQSGTSLLNFIVSDRFQTVTNMVTLEVTNINNLPTISFPTMSSGAPATNVIAGGTISNIAITVGDVETSPRNILVTASSSDTNLIPNENIILAGSGPDRTLTLTTVGTGTGNVTISVVATDENGGVTTKTFVVSITPTPGSVFANSGVILIPATGTIGNASPYPSTIGVGGLSGTISKISVIIDGLTHTAPDDIDILLVSPSGKKSILISDVGGANPISNVRLVFDASGRRLADDAPIISGTYLPTDFEVGSDIFPSPAPAGPYPASLDEFLGTDPNGSWSLYIVDDATGNSGQIQFGWSLRIETAPTIVLNPGSLNAPGGTPTFVQFAEDTSANISFTIGDSANTPFGNLGVSFVNSNPNLFASIVTNLSGNVVTATLNPVTNGFGTNNLTITVRRSDGAQSSIVVPMNVTPVNDLPTISRLVDRTISADTPVSIPILITDVDTPLNRIWVSATSGNTAVISSTNILIAGTTNFLKGLVGNQSSPAAFPPGTLDSSTNFITIVPNTAAFSATAVPITINVMEVDGSGNVLNTVSSVFNVTVTPVNHAPAIIGVNGNAIPSVIAVEAGQSTTNIAFNVSDADNDSLTITATSSDQTLVRNSDVIIDVPSGLSGGIVAGAGNRHVRVITQPGVQGDALITLTVKDPSGAQAVVSFTVRVIPTRERIFANNHPITIRDNNSADPYPSQISVDGFSGAISKVTVTLNGFWHTFPDDVDMILVSPTGKKSYLMSDAGGGNPVPSSAAINIKFDDTDPNAGPVPDNAQLTSTTYKVANYEGTTTDDFVNRTPPGPAGPYAVALSTFNGDSPNGLWSLYIVDDTLQDGGAITNGWSIGITTLPILAGLQDVVSQEDVPVRVPFTIAEESFANPTAFTFAVSSTNTALVPSSTNNIVISGTGTNRVVTVIPNPNANSSNANGPTLITITEQTSGVSGHFLASFTPVNDAPVITQIADQVVPVGSFITVTNFDYSDVETPKKNLTVSIDSSDPGAIPTNNVVLVGNDLRIFSDTRAGVSRITITVTDTGDGVNPPVSTSMSFVVTVSAGQNPVFSNTDGITIPEIGTATPYPSTIEVRGVNGTITKVSVTLRGLSHTFPDDVDILLVGPNGKGVVVMSDAGGSGVLTNAFLTFDDSATQSLPDNSQIQPFDTYKPTDYEVSNSEFAPSAPAGPYSATFSGAFNGSIPNGTWSLYVQDDSRPDGGHINGWSLSIVTTAPTISTIPDAILTEDTATNVNFTVASGGTAASNLVVTATLQVDDRGPLLNAIRQTDGSFQIPVTGSDTNRSITLTPALHVTGTTRVIVSVTDGTSVTQTSFNVVIVPVNHRPVITGLSDTNTPANARLRLNFTVSDVETATSNLVVTASNSNPAAGSLTLDTTGATPSLVFNPAGVPNTSTTVMVIVSDGQLSTTNSFVITVTPAVTPGISAISTQHMDENTSLLVSFTITTTSSTNVTITGVGLNTNLVSSVTIGGTGANRTALINLLPNQSGFSEIDITITDDFGSATSAFPLFVQPVPIPASLDTIPDQTTPKNVPVTIVLPVNNPDHAPLASLIFSGTTSKPSLVTGFSFGQVGTDEVAVINVGTNQTGIATVTISVTDGSKTNSTTFALEVTANQSPVLAPIGDRTVLVNTVLTIPLQVSDVDDPISRLTITGSASNPALVSSIRISNDGTNVSATISLVPDAVGTSAITVTVKDASNTPVNQSFNLDVIAKRQTPATLTAILSGGTLNLKVQGDPSTTYVIERSSDLVNWTTYGAVTLDSTGSKVISDVGTFFGPYQFFRARNQ